MQTPAGSDARLVRIDDPADPRLADYRDLTDVALRRRTEPAQGLYIAESAKVIARAVAAGHRPRSVLVQEKWLADAEALTEDAPIYIVTDAVAEQLTGYVVHRGALAAMQRPVLRSVADTVAGARLVLVLEDIVDHTNVGAAFRAAAGLGADAVLVTPRCADPLYRRSVRVSMGTVFQVPWTRLPEDADGSWTSAREALREAGLHVAALALADDAVPLDVFAAARPAQVALVLGAEGDGLSARALASADTIVTIPMAGGVDSLNVASAAAVAMWALR
ncbi:MAG: rRNA methyltransferase [Microbacterium sp. SCN 70-200]|uniref:TrmH family RNA methyltransferase n=1 Tax=unclassified Microbacterium TaxID=2609290 RepID=UPI00086C0BF8|nr:MULTISPECIES: RNA methyltransferase [unclassified Microbacterium]MBN9214348.1 RNA methyltransferase [Microbacterium sp.]ODT40986.1 MAG: rRNA methyltransferase [Microbacterium sp. SCN 70-200]OJV83843.1 MAG: rRNA methyltransferase [Microbacterium sp. 70-16]